MRLKRKLKAREVIFNVNKLQMEVRDHYEESLEEVWYKKLLKDGMFYSLLIGFIISIVGIILSEGKIFIVLNTMILMVYGYVIYRKIKTFKEQD
jgi:hypothetical protein